MGDDGLGCVCIQNIKIWVDQCCLSEVSDTAEGHMSELMRWIEAKLSSSMEVVSNSKIASHRACCQFATMGKIESAFILSVGGGVGDDVGKSRR